MRAVGIIAEYNPFHTGHGYQISSSRRAMGEECAVVAAMSGNWVQGGRCAIADKWRRAELALLGGVDLVLELPAPWALSSAESFALGGVGVLAAAGVVDTISFGSEAGEIAPLAAAADCLDSEAFRACLREELASGAAFPLCRQRAVSRCIGRAAGEVLSTPNNNLGIEYLRAIRRLGAQLQPITVRRAGAGHDEVTSRAVAFRSATQLRGALERGDWAEAEPYLGREAADRLQAAPRPSAQLLERLMLARLRTMEEADWAALPDGGAGEGLPARLCRAGRQAASLEEFYALSKTRRYAHARLRRLAVWAYLGMKAGDRGEGVPCLRVLGFNDRGRALLGEMRKKAALPIVVKPALGRQMGAEVQQLLELESRCTDLYDLLLPQPGPGGREWRTSPVRMEGMP